MDDCKKLKPNAISTLFNLPNCPKPFTPQGRTINKSIIEGVDTVVATETSCGLETSTSLAEYLLIMVRIRAYEPIVRYANL